ncbi:MAG: ligase-associated DNA damage response endonuclease PdeM, partial [Flavobacteriales bacterium]
MKITIRGEELILDKERAIYFPEQKILAISDLHLGKAAHFRKAGLQIPSTLAQSDLQRLANLLDHYQPSTLLINGDMFHHEINTDIAVFEEWKAAYKNIKFALVKGNHDHLHNAEYEQLGIEIHEPSFCTSNFCFIHDAVKCKEKELYPISGHVHPGISIVGKAKQRLKFQWKDTTKWRRKNYDLHNILGFYVSAIALIVALTGMVWAFTWFQAIVYVAGSGSITPPDYHIQKSVVQPGDKDAAMEKAYTYIKEHHKTASAFQLSPAADSIAAIGAYVQQYKGVYYVSHALQFDQYTGKLLHERRHETKNFGEKLITANYDIHVGAI